MMLQACLQISWWTSPGHRDPRGMIASRIEPTCPGHSSLQEHECLVTALNQAHPRAEETVSKHAACYAAILPEERREGIALSNRRPFQRAAVYYGDALQLARVSALRRSLHQGHRARPVHNLRRRRPAEGKSMMRSAGLTADNSLIEVPSREDRGSEGSARRLLNRSSSAKRKNVPLGRASWQGRDGSGADGRIVCAAGGARLNGMCDMAERVRNCQAARAAAGNSRLAGRN